MTGGVEPNVLTAEQVNTMAGEASLAAEWIRMVPWSDSRTHLARQLTDLAASHEVLRRRQDETRKALAEVAELAAVCVDGDHWYAQEAGLDAEAILAAAREVLS